MRSALLLFLLASNLACSQNNDANIVIRYQHNDARFIQSLKPYLAEELKSFRYEIYFVKPGENPFSHNDKPSYGINISVFEKQNSGADGYLIHITGFIHTDTCQDRLISHREEGTNMKPHLLAKSISNWVVQHYVPQFDESLKSYPLQCYIS